MCVCVCTCACLKLTASSISKHPWWLHKGTILYSTCVEHSATLLEKTDWMQCKWVEQYSDDWWHFNCQTWNLNNRFVISKNLEVETHLTKILQMERHYSGNLQQTDPRHLKPHIRQISWNSNNSIAFSSCLTIALLNFEVFKENLS